MMRLFSRALAAALALVLLLTSCAAPGPRQPGADSRETAPLDTGLPRTDLNGNGIDEVLEVTWPDETDCLLTVTEDGEVIFSEEGSISHAGWNALFLCRRDGQDYLLRYWPTMYQGYANYGYTLFSLAPDGSEVVERENNVRFDVNFGPNHVEGFDPVAIAAFLDEVNGLLDGSVQLLNTDVELTEAFAREGRLYHVPGFVYGEGYDPEGSLLENLETCKTAMEAAYTQPG